MKLFFAMTLLASPALAQDAVGVCPAAPDHATEEAEIIAQLQKAADDLQARPLADQLWRLWTDAPD
ncbi:MAG: hypothetical protein KKB02_03715, partial [Alphaproteobacteria bacterium]|nr:hypothetical protein [Alphaproteobacteria bacterium]